MASSASRCLRLHRVLSPVTLPNCSLVSGEQVVSSRLMHGGMKPVVKIGGLVDGVTIRFATT